MSEIGGHVNIDGYGLAVVSSASNAAAQASNKALVQRLPVPELALVVQAGLTSLVFLASFLSQDGALLQLSAAFGSSQFQLAVLASGAINIVASQLSQLGLKRGELGDTLPFLSLTPAFLLVSEYVLLQESTSTAGAAGVALVSAGGFLLSRASVTSSTGKGQSKFALPPGSGIFMVIAVIYSISSAFDKRGVQAASPLLYGATIQFLIAAGAAISCIFRHSAATTFAQFTGSLSSAATWRLLLGQWAFSMAAYWCQLQATQRILSSHLSAIRRAGCLFGLLLGRLIFAESIGRKLLPVSVMVFGVCLLAAK